MGLFSPKTKKVKKILREVVVKLLKDGQLS